MVFKQIHRTKAARQFWRPTRCGYKREILNSSALTRLWARFDPPELFLILLKLLFLNVLTLIGFKLIFCHKCHKLDVWMTYASHMRLFCNLPVTPVDLNTTAWERWGRPAGTLKVEHTGGGRSARSAFRTGPRGKSDRWFECCHGVCCSGWGARYGEQGQGLCIPVIRDRTNITVNIWCSFSSSI